MNTTLDQVLALLGSKEVEIMLLKQRIAALEAELLKLQPKAEAPQ